MPAGNLNLLDLMLQKLGDNRAIIDETKIATPEVTGVHPLTQQTIPMVADARPIAGVTYETTVYHELPTVTLRDMNEGTDPTKASAKKVTASCCGTTPRWGVDKLAETIDNSLASLLAKQGVLHVAAYLQLLGRLFFYGKLTAQGGDAKSFPGLIQSVDATNMVVDATGSGNGCSSVWAVRFGEDAVQWLSGNNNQVEVTDPRVGDFNGANGKPCTGIIQELVARPGLFVGSQLVISRIKNLTTATGKKLTGDMLGELITKHRLSYRPNAIFLTKRSLEQYRQDLQATTSSVSRVPTPTEFEGIPLVPTESLLDTEPANLAG